MGDNFWFVTPEHLFDMAMTIQRDRDFDMEGISGQIIVRYAAIEITDGDPDNEELITDESLNLKVSEYIITDTLNSLCNKGLVQEDFDGNYSLTEVGLNTVANKYQAETEE